MKTKNPKKTISDKKSKVREENINLKHIKESGDLDNIRKKIEKLEKHITKNRQDRTAKRAILTLKARVYKLERYQKKKNKRE